jgi:hypothetical protein
LTALPIYRDIDGLHGREPVGAVLTVGRKSSEKGNPVETDRFFIVQPNEERGIRPQHPSYQPFNGADVKLRQSVAGNFVHATIAEAWSYHLAAIRLPKPHPNAPDMRPTCTGDGRAATRYMGEQRGFEQIPCPNSLCEYRQGEPPSCRPFGRLYFRPRWTGGKLPELLFKYETRAWRTISNIVGFFAHVSTQAEHLGLIPPRPEGAEFNPLCPIYGLPFVLTMGRRTQAKKQRSFPVVTISPDVDLVSFYLGQRKQLAEMGGRLQLAAGNGDPHEESPPVIAAAYRALEPDAGIPSIPSSATPLEQARSLVDKYAPAHQRGVIQEAWDVTDWDAVTKLGSESLQEGIKYLMEAE